MRVSGVGGGDKDAGKTRIGDEQWDAQRPKV